MIRRCPIRRYRKGLSYMALFYEENRTFTSYSSLKRAAKKFLAKFSEGAVPFDSYYPRATPPFDTLRQNVRDKRVARFYDPILRFQMENGHMVRANLSGQKIRVRDDS